MGMFLVRLWVARVENQRYVLASSASSVPWLALT